MHCLFFCTACCSNVNQGMPEPDVQQNVFRVSRVVDPDTNIAYVTFSRPLNTSDVDDVDLDSPLYLHFGYSAANIMNISDPRTNIWTSRSPIQFDCSRDCKHTVQPCSAAVCVVCIDCHKTC